MRTFEEFVEIQEELQQLRLDILLNYKNTFDRSSLSNIINLINEDIRRGVLREFNTKTGEELDKSYNFYKEFLEFIRRQMK